MATNEWIIMLLWVNLGAVAGMLYALRRIFLLEKNILRLEQVLLRLEKMQLPKTKNKKK